MRSPIDRILEHAIELHAADRLIAAAKRAWIDLERAHA